MTQQNATQQRPIGYWLKRADELLTRRSNQILHDHGFTRFHWQTLNILYEKGSTSFDDIFAILSAFVTVDQLNDILALFSRSGWLLMEKDDSTTTLTLTEAGKAQHATIFQLQSEVRRQSMQGISNEEYAMVVDVLQRLVHNLE